MFSLLLKITDPEDGTYFINKALNRLHGYMRHSNDRFAMIFSRTTITLYSLDENLLQTLLDNKAMAVDIKRGIFTAQISAVTTAAIPVFMRVHDISSEQKLARLNKNGKKKLTDAQQKKC